METQHYQRQRRNRMLRTVDIPTPEPLRPEYFKHMRKHMNMTQRELAVQLQMGSGGVRTVRRWEKGELPVPGPVHVAMGLLAEKYNADLD